MAFFGYFLSPRKESNPPEAKRKGRKESTPWSAKREKSQPSGIAGGPLHSVKPPIPNFICTHSPSIFLDFQGVSAFGVLAVTPFLHHFRIWLYWILSDYTILLKLLDGIIQRFGSHMNVPIHCCFDAGMTQQFLQHLRLHTAFDCSCSIGMSQGVHTKVFDPCFIAELI